MEFEYGYKNSNAEGYNHPTPLVDIKTINYLSDGRSINITFWFQPGSFFHSLDYPTPMLLACGIRIDADSDEVTGWNGADFSY